MDFSKNYNDAKEFSMQSDQIKSDINTMLIVKVVKVYASTQRVDVQPCITVKKIDNDSKTQIYTRTGQYAGVSEIAMPILLNVPICFPRAGNLMVTLPVTVGDTGMLIISQQDLTQWKQKGGDGIAQDDISLFDINNGVYVPFVPNDVTAVSDYNATAMELRNLAGTAKIKIDNSGTIAITGDVTVTGTLTATTDVVGGGKSLKTHTHTTLLNASALAAPAIIPATSGSPN
jgi:hypothetical protein